jgi:DNA-binding MarR family transcriptional regulator
LTTLTIAAMLRPMAVRRTARSRIKAPDAGRTQRRPAPAEQRPSRALDLGGLDQVIGFVLRRAQIAAFQDYALMMDDLAISTAQFAVMRLAYANPGVNQIALADALGADPPRMVSIIDDLERRGLVKRLASTVDRRARAIFLTPEGGRLHATLSRRVAKQNRRMVQRLRGADAAALLRMLRDVASPL